MKPGPEPLTREGGKKGGGVIPVIRLNNGRRLLFIPPIPGLCRGPRGGARVKTCGPRDKKYWWGYPTAMLWIWGWGGGGKGGGVKRRIARGINAVLCTRVRPETVDCEFRRHDFSGESFETTKEDTKKGTKISMIFFVMGW